MKHLIISHKYNRLSRVLGIFALVGLISAAATRFVFAQDSVNESEVSKGGVIEEVMVTARRRTEQLQDYAGTAAVFGKELLRDARVDGLEDIVDRISNAYFEERSGGAINIFLRGAGTATNGSATRTDTGVGLYYDDIYSYIQGSRIPLVFYDLDRVEVFKGPQGGLYGRNAVGGAVAAHTALPDGEFEAFASFEYGEFDAITAEGAVNVPINDQFSLRVAAYHDERDSYYDNIDPSRSEKGDEVTGGRVRLRFQPNQDWDVVLGFEYLDEDKGPQSIVPAQFGEDFVSATGTDGGVDRETSRFLSKIHWRPVEGIEVRSITGYTEIDATDSSDLNNLLFQPLLNEFFVGIQTFTTDAYQVAQEIMVLSTDDEPLQWLVGASYFKDDKDGTSAITSGFPTLGLANSFSTNELGIEMYAVFADATYKVTDKLILGLSLRYSDEQRTGIRSDSVIVDPNTGIPIPANAFEFDDSYDKLSPGGSITYFWTEDIMTYAKISTGYQSGGINSRASSPDTSTFGPSTAVNYELGLRTTWFDERLTANFTVFRMDQDDYQFQTGSVPFREFINAGEAETDGVEIEIVARPFEWLTIPVTYGYLDARITDAPNARANIEGLPLVGIPKNTGTIGADIRFPIMGGRNNAYFKIDYAFVRNRFDTGGLGLDDYEVLNMKAGIEFGDRYEVHFYAENLTDDVHVITPSLAGSQLISPPRVIGGGFSAKFF